MIDGLNQLLSLSSQVAEINTFTQLSDFYYDHLRPVMHFEDSVIITVDKKNKEQTVEFKCNSQAGYSPIKNTLENWVGLIHKKNAVHVWDLAEFDFWRYECYLLIDWDLNKVEKILSIPASINDNPGIILYGFTAENKDEAENNLVLNTLSQQIYAVVSRLVSNELLKQRNFEDNFISSLAGAISSVKSKMQLFEKLNKELKKLWNEDSIFLSFIDIDSQTQVLIGDDDLNLSTSSQFWKDRTLPLNDPFSKKLVSLTANLELKIAKLNEDSEPPVHLKRWLKNDYSDILVIPIVEGATNIGVVFILSKQEGSKLARYGNLIKGISIHLTSIMKIIQGNERIKQKEEEKRTILEISNDIAMTRNKEDLIKVLMRKLKALVPFDDCLLTTFNKDKKTHSAWAFHYELRRQQYSNFKGTTTSDHPVNDGILNEIFKSEDPVIFDIDSCCLRPDAPEYIHSYQETGIAELAAAIMKNGNIEIGGFFLTSEHKGNFQKKHRDIIKGLSSQLCIAVANILANEKVSEHEREKSLLLDLSNRITTVKNKHQLLYVLENELKTVLSFDYIAIFLNNPEINGLYLNSANLKIEDRPAEQQLEQMFIPDDVIDILTREKDLILFTTDQYITKSDQKEPVSTFFKGNSIREFVGISLRDGDNLVGRLYFLSRDLNTFRKTSFNLFQGVSYQLTLAIDAILSSQKIFEKEQEKSILLSISNEFSGIKNKNDFQTILQERLRKLFYFSHTLTTISDLITQTYTGYIFDPMSSSRSHPDYMHNFKAKYSLVHPIINLVTSAKEPVVFDLEELNKRPDLPDWIKMNVECGLKEMVITELYVRNKHLGFYVIFSDQKGRINSKMLKLIQGIASQTSIAVANLMANEELSEKESEKSTLLELSSDIAKIRNKSDLQKIIDEKVRKLLHISHYAICMINEDEKGYFLFINDENAITKIHKDYAEATSVKSLNKSGLMSIALTSEQPVVFDMDELIKIPDVPDIFKINHEAGLKEVVFANLNDSRRKIGFIVLFYHQKMGLNMNGINLIKGISAQLSTAISNIVSNERIVSQLNEISNYKRQLEEENQYLQEEIHTTYNYSEIIGSDKSMEAVFRLVSQVADTTSSVLILGETGTGKELIARAIHNSSLRKDKVMVKVNCATLPANLVESELFGHERGSFTGATERRIGKFELANNSTLFLDEVGELPLDLQVKLLRALQEKEIERVGGKTVIKTNVRIIAATNRNLKKEVQLGNFRSDLFFRLNVFPIILPPLRERRDDIPDLALHFLSKYSNKASKFELKFSSRVMKQLVAYQWPGNVRELEHLIERSILLTNGPTVNQIDLPDIDGEEGHSFGSGAMIKTIDEVERDYIISILKKCNGKIAGIGGAADLLKIPSTTLNSKIAKLKINKGLIQLKPSKVETLE